MINYDMEPIFEHGGEEYATLKAFEGSLMYIPTLWYPFVCKYERQTP